MSQLPLHTFLPGDLDPGRTAPLVHKWFARRRPEAIRKVLDGLDGLDGLGEERNLRIMDPFAGSGMILLECLTRGYDVFGADINPVAWLIARQTLDPPNVERCRWAFQTIDDAVGPQIRSLFRTITPANAPADTVTAFYVRIVRTIDGRYLELHHNYLIARNRKKNWAVYYCPACGTIFESSCLDCITCSECHSKFDWREGSVFKGRIKVGADSVSLAELYGQETIGPQFKLIGVESYSSETGRQYHKPSRLDYMNIESARSQCMDHEIAKEICSIPIPTDRRDPRPISHGFLTYGQLFAPRQLLSLALIADAVKVLEDEELRYAMALALSDTAGSNNMMCRYAADWLKLTPAFGLHGFDVVTRPVEGNVWGAALGRGSFNNCVAKATRAYATIRSTLNEVEASRKTPITREVRCVPAQALSELNWKPMDAVVTDPPYFDNLDYGELGDFYFQWLKISLDSAPPFDQQYSLNASDLARIAALKKDPLLFSDELSQILRQAAEHLEPLGVLAFSYHHAKSKAWKCLARALRNASIAPYKLRFVRSELDNGFHSSSGNIKIDSIFYCRKVAGLEDVDSDAILGDALSNLSELSGLKSIDLVSAGYAIAAALVASNPSGDFADLLTRVKRVAGWE